MIVPGVVAPRYMEPAMLPRHSALETTMPYRNRQQTYALLHWEPVGLWADLLPKSRVWTTFPILFVK